MEEKITTIDGFKRLVFQLLKNSNIDKFFLTANHTAEILSQHDKFGQYVMTTQIKNLPYFLKADYNYHYGMTKPFFRLQIVNSDAEFIHSAIVLDVTKTSDYSIDSWFHTCLKEVLLETYIKKTV